ncbi:MAG: DNA mismatch repair protein MutS [Candidatus Dojkabacteria bacterium]|nr:MAG: DNA mismatch repair protein MutS [Candidatus Dojkabacteria bacterium]
MQSTTPLMQQYQEIKSAYSDAILLFQMGDFFECFGEDAVTISQVLGIVLTKREKKADAPQMAGFPQKALDEYLPKLVHAGYKVAVARQMEPPTGGKGIVKRAVTEVITQGTITQQESLLSQDKNYLAAIVVNKNLFGLAIVDVTTGELKVYEDRYAPDKTAALIDKIAPREILHQHSFNLQLSPLSTTVKQPLSDVFFDVKKSIETVTSHFNVPNLDPLGLHDKMLAAIATGVLIAYVSDTKKVTPKHIQKIELWNPYNYLLVDSITQKNLDIFSNQRTHSLSGSLFGVIDKTITPMGHRKLFEWISFPLTEQEEITKRFDVVSFFIENQEQINTAISELEEIHDIERYAGLLGLGRIHHRQLSALAYSISHVLTLKSLLSSAQNDTLIPLLHSALETIEDSPLKELQSKISTALPGLDETSSTLFKKGFNAELDELITLSTDGNKLIKDIFTREKEQSGITNLKLGFNKVFGYYFETSRANEKLIPSHFIKKQTLVNTDRFITQEVKDLEEKVLHAQDRLATKEQEVYAALVAELQGFIGNIQSTAAAVSAIDVLLNFARVAITKGYARPSFVKEGESIVFTDARHPVVNEFVPDFVPNSLTINKDKNFIILTGPNMGGKSTFVRQIALIHILAQAGSFVPAQACNISIIDKLFARIGASDDIASGRSTFMVELSEVANIIRHATEKSFVILDEVGRGTSTYEGIALAWGISEYIAKHIKCTTIFTTHFREITLLEKEDTPYINFKVNIKEENNDVYFLHTISPGVSDKSYGIHVAKLVDLPGEIIKTAQKMLDRFEHERPVQQKNQPPADQLGMFSLQAPVEPQEVIPDNVKAFMSEVASLQLETMTPLEAISVLASLQQKLPDVSE